MGAVQLIPANLATVCIESFLYGIFFVLATTSTYILIRRERISRKQFGVGYPVYRNPMLIAGIALLCTVTSHWVFTVTRLFQAFTLFEGGSDPLFFYGDLRQATEVGKTAVLLVSLLIGDIMITYRLWIIWGYNKRVIIFPICTILGLFACAVGITYVLAVYDPTEVIFSSQTNSWITGDVVCTLCTNIYSSSMIAYRIWTRIRGVGSTGHYVGRNIMDVFVIIVESAALYTTWTLFFFITYEAGTNVQYVAVDTWAAVAGISYMLINLRVGLGWAQRAYPSPSFNNAGTSGLTFGSHGSPQQQRRYSYQGYSLRPVAVTIDQVVTQQVDFELPLSSDPQKIGHDKMDG